MCKMRLAGVFSVILALVAVHAAPQNDVSAEETSLQMERYLTSKLSAACANDKLYACTKLKLLVYTDKIWKKPAIQMSEDVVLTRTSNEEAAVTFVSSPRELAEQDDDAKLWALVTGKARAFLRSRELRWRLLPETELVVASGRDGNDVNFKLAVNTARAVETARLKIKSFFLLASAGLAKFGLIAALKFFALVALVVKAVVVSKVALAAAVAVSIARLLWWQPTVTYEVVSHPHVSHTVSHSIPAEIHSSPQDSYSVGYGHSRSGPPVDHIAYSAHVPK